MQLIKRRGTLVVVSAPSGAGKTTLCHEVRTLVPDLYYSVSYTTRSPRHDETNGTDFFFVTEGAFTAMRARDEFAEWAEVHGHLYGTSRGAIEERITGGHDVLLEIDWQGARQVRALFPDLLGMFILPPSIAELARRLQGRGKDTPETIARRLSGAREEISHVLEFEYIIVNEHFEEALADLMAVVRGARVSRAQQAVRFASLIDEFR